MTESICRKIRNPRPLLCSFFFSLHVWKLALQSVGSHEKVLCRWSLGKSVAFLNRWMVCWVFGGNELQGEGKTTDKASKLERRVDRRVGCPKRNLQCFFFAASLYCLLYC